MTYQLNLDYLNSVGCHSGEFFGGIWKAEGYELQQNPIEFAKFLTYLQEKGPFSRYLEIGSASGGFIRCIHERLGFKAALMIDDGAYQANLQLKNIEGFRDKVSRYIMNSHSKEAKEVLDARVFDLIFIDGDHSYEGVLADIDLVIPHAHKDTLICFHDIDCPEVPGVKRAYEETLERGILKEEIRFLEPRERMTFGLSVTKLPYDPSRE